MKNKFHPKLTLLSAIILINFPSSIKAQWDPTWYPGGAGFNPQYNGQPIMQDAAPWAQGGNMVQSLPPGNVHNYSCGTGDGSPFALMAGGSELIHLDLQQRVAIGYWHTPQVNDCVLDIKGSNSEFRIYGDADGNVESTTSIKITHGTNNGQSGSSFQVGTAHAIVGFLPQIEVNSASDFINHYNGFTYGNSQTHGKMVIGPAGFGGFSLNTRLSLDSRTMNGLHVETSNGNNALWVVNGAGANRFRVWVNSNGGEDTKMHMAGAAQFGFTGHGSNTMVDNNVRINLDAYGMEGLKVTTNNSGNKMIYVNNSGSNTFEVRGNGATYIGNWRANANGPCANAMLTVDGQILAKDIRVAISQGSGAADRWADYVFDKDYKLMPLREIEKFVLKNHHLPEVPSEKEVLKNGVDLKEMNITLLKKVEELYLYVIELEKKVNEKTSNK